MIRNLDRLTSGQADNVRVYKSTSSYEHVKLSSDSISSILDFAAAIEQFQNMHKISVPAVSLAPKSGDTTRCVNVVDNLGFPQVCVDNLNVFTTPLLIRQWSKNSFCYVLLNIELANVSRSSWHE